MHTKRLEIRRFHENDWKDVYLYLSDKDVVLYEPYLPMDEQQCRDFTKQMAQSKDFWAVFLQDQVIGQVYLAKQEQQAFELGYVFHKQYQRKGYATEATHCLVEYAFAQKGAHRVFANCDPKNTPSWKLLERLGFRREGHLKQNVYFHIDENGSPIWKDTFIYGLLAEEQKPGNPENNKNG